MEDSINKEAWKLAIREAFKVLDVEKWNPINNSTLYDVVYQENKYPPKEVFRHAANYIGENHPNENIPTLSGGIPINTFIQELGYTVVNKEQLDDNLEKQLRAEFKNIWRCADSFKWNYIKQTNLLTFDWLDAQTDYRTINIHKLPSGKRSIQPWVEELQINDLVFIMGKNTFNGIAIIKSRYAFEGPFIDMGDTGEKPAIALKYIFKLDEPVAHPIKTHNNPTTFARIDLYKFSLHKVLNFLNQSLPEAIEAFHHYFNTKNISKELEEPKKVIYSKKQIILQGPPGTGKTRLAKELAYNLITNEILSTDESTRAEQLNELNTAQYRLIQFHPSYTYEDFIRGIVTKNKGDQISYETENKILVELAKNALKNYEDHHKEVVELEKEKWVEEQYQDFIETIQSHIDEHGKYDLNSNVFISEANDSSFRYLGQAWGSSTNGHNMKHDDIITAYLNGYTLRKEISKSDILSGSAKQHATYYYLVLKLFLEFIEGKKITSTTTEKVPLQNYVLIIDEINRANLSSVLGELIYALEYRGEVVDAIYPLDDKREIILPPNLYIIGTMNTADRSVGHIDYAVRRRFAFIDVLPKILDIDNFQKESFLRISTLFIDGGYNENKPKNFIPSEYLSEEFKAEDVCLGHSYFIADKNTFQNINLPYEIKPILKEYVKDGILKESALEIIETLE